MLPSLLTVPIALLLIASSYALSIDSSVHLARHQQIAARHPEVKRASVSARCKKRNSNSTSGSTVSSNSLPTNTAPPASTSSQAPPPSSPHTGGTGKVGIAWAYNDDPSLKNFITQKVSRLVDLFFISSSRVFLIIYI